MMKVYALLDANVANYPTYSNEILASCGLSYNQAAQCHQWAYNRWKDKWILYYISPTDGYNITTCHPLKYLKGA